MTRRLQSDSFFTKIDFQRREKTRASGENREPNVDIANRENPSRKTSSETKREKRRYTQDKNFSFSVKKTKVHNNLEEDNKRGDKAVFQAV